MTHPGSTPDPITLAELAADLATLYERAATVDKRLASTRQVVAAMDDMLTQLVSRRGAGPQVFRWDDLDTPDRQQRWAAFTDWVTTIAARYGYDEIPGCPQWNQPQHWPIIEELTALWLTWAAAHTPAADSDAPRRFHEALWRARERLEHLRGACTTTRHHQPLTLTAQMSHTAPNAMDTGSRPTSGTTTPEESQ